MTTKKYVKYFEKQCKTILNISCEPIFKEYIVTQNGKRIGVLYENKLYLLSTTNLKKLLPDSIEENPFGWAYYKLIFIKDTENAETLSKLISAVYHDLYFLKDYVFDLSDLLKPYHRESDTISDIYNAHITFLRFCYEKGLLKRNPLDKENRIIYMRYVNKDLTEKGHLIFDNLHLKWLAYNDRNDSNSEKRIHNVLMLEKYYNQIIQDIDLAE